MVKPVLHYHPLSSYCWKLLIALDELGVEVDQRVLNFGDAAQREAYRTLWPMAKMPLLVDGGRAIPETSIIIEYVQRHHAREGHALIPAGADEALEVRLWDRLFDQYVMTPMQAFTNDLLRPEGQRDPVSVDKARQALLQAYALIEQRMDGRTWVAAEQFSMADCAAAPSLFYAVAYVPLGASHPRLAAYVDRLMDRPSVARTVDAARPFFQYFPGRAGLSRRFYEPERA